MMNLQTTAMVQLRAMAKAEGLKNYSKLNKAELIAVLTNHLNKETDIMAYNNAYLSSEPTIIGDDFNRADSESDIILEETVTIEQPTAKTITGFVTDFDIERYAKFIPSNTMQANPKTANQLNLAKSLENNFKVSINTETCNNFYELSVKLSKVYSAILNGKVTRRPSAEVEARVLASTPVQDNKATTKQLEAITRLEKETGVTVKTVISDKFIADKVIKTLIASKKQAETLKEVAVDKAPTCFGQFDKFNNPTFRTKFTAMMKRILA